MENKERIYAILEDNGINTEWIEEEKSVFFEDSDYWSAIVGVTDSGKIVYDYNKMIDHLIDYEDYESCEDAADHICYNTIRAKDYFGRMTPIIMFPVDQGTNEYNFKIASAVREIADFCGKCPNVMCCKEKDCVVFRIENKLI